MANIIRAASRRDVLKIGALAAAGAMLGAPSGRAAPKALTLHAREFVHPGLRRLSSRRRWSPAYEKATGIKVNYELISVGSLQTRVTTAAETGTGPDMTLIDFNWPFLFDEKLVDVSDIADEIGKKNGGWYDAIKEAVIVNGKWKAIPFGNIGQLMNWRTDWFAEAGIQDVSRHLGRAAGSRHQAEEGGPSIRLRAWPRLRRQPWLAVSAAVVVRRARGRAGRQDRRDRFRRDGARGRFLPQVLPADDVRGLPGLDRRQQQQGVSEPSRSPAPTTPRASCGVAKKDFPDIGKVIEPVAQSAGAEGALPHPQPVEPLDLHPHAGPAGGEGLPALADGSEAGRAAGMTSADQLLRAVSCTPTTTRRCGTSSRATCRIAIRSRPRICRAGRRRSAARSRRAWRNTSSSTCSPRPAPASRPRR